MTSIPVKHTVEDYDAWKQGYDSHASTRGEYGEQGSRLFRVSDEPNEIVALYEWVDILLRVNAEESRAVGVSGLQPQIPPLHGSSHLTQPSWSVAV